MIQQVILHIIGDGSAPSVSSRPINLSSKIAEYFEKQIEKVEMDPNLQRCVIGGDSPLVDPICGMTENITEASARIADILAARASELEGTYCFDLAAVRYGEVEAPCYGILLLRYRDGYMHRISHEGVDTSAEIVPCGGLLPASGQRIEAALLYDTGKDVCRMIEKSVTCCGEKQGFWETLIGSCTPEPSLKQSLNTVKKIAEEVIQNTGSIVDFESAVKIQTAIADQVESSGEVDVFTVGDILFEDEPELQAAYRAIAEGSGIAAPAPVPVSAPRVEAGIQKLKFKTDTGIELTIPLPLYKDSMKVENHEDGTLTISLEGIGEIKKMG